MTWILIICTAGWGLCGGLYEYEYPTEESCYIALEQMVSTAEDDITYAICQPREYEEQTP